jgi:hypothetical protein
MSPVVTILVDDERRKRFSFLEIITARDSDFRNRSRLVGIWAHCIVPVLCVFWRNNEEDKDNDRV